MRRLIILTEGFTETIAAKTASSVLRYRPHEVVALRDGAHPNICLPLRVGGDLQANLRISTRANEPPRPPHR